MTGPSGRDVRLGLDTATMDLRGFVQLTRQVRPTNSLDIGLSTQSAYHVPITDALEAEFPFSVH